MGATSRAPILKMMKTFIALTIMLVIAQHATASVDETEFTEVSTDHIRAPRGCHLKCHRPACSVTVYQHCNFRGYRINLKPGSYNMHQLKRKGMKNDDLSSIHVHGACKAKLYEHWNFTGKSKTMSRHDSCFTNDHMPMSMLSIKIEEDDAPTQELSEVADKWWWRRRHHHRRSWNDQTSSIKVFNRNGLRCSVDCRERDHKLRERSHKLRVREIRDKHHKREKKAKADAKKEKAAKAKAKAQEKASKKKEKAAKAKAKAHEKAKKKKHKKAQEVAMKKAFKKNKKKVAMCAKGFDVKGKNANHYKGRCRSFYRFCHMYKKYGLHDDAQRHCDNAKTAHKKMMHHHHKATKKAKKHHHHKRHHHKRHHHHHLPHHLAPCPKGKICMRHHHHMNVRRI